MNSESEYWLELLIESGYNHNVSILDQCIEIKKLLISSINTAKKNSKAVISKMDIKYKNDLFRQVVFLFGGIWPVLFRFLDS